MQPPRANLPRGALGALKRTRSPQNMISGQRTKVWVTAAREEMDEGFKKSDDVVAKEKEDRDLEHAANSDEKDNELVAVTTSASERLPFSKARCIALVATVAAAPFLTVRFLSHVI
jgi:hypothetical protein